MSINLLILIIGLVSVSIIDAIGSVTSRKYKFDYSNLLVVSLLVYFLVGFFGAKFGNLKFALMCPALVGFFDATIGWDISIKLSAQTKKNLMPQRQSKKNKVIFFVTVLAFVTGIFGCLAGNNI